jgi:hypothetical protein
MTMTRLKWHSFKTSMPEMDTAIMVKDHENNCSPGVWRGHFVPFFPIPIGFIKKWTDIKVLIRKTEHYDIIDAEVIYFPHGVSLKIEEIYDFHDPI